MTDDKKRKKAVRERMKKTGESYTAAKAQLETPEPAASISRIRPNEQSFSMEYGGGVISGPGEAHVRKYVADVEAEKARRARWPPNGREALEALAAKFPSLARAPGVKPWDQDAFLRWLCNSGLSHGELLAARFVLGVWNSSTRWDEIAREEGFEFPENAVRFDIFEALSTWDRAHADAFVAWADAPFWP